MGTLHIGSVGIDFVENPFKEYMRTRIEELGIDLSSDDYINDPKFKELFRSFVTEDMASVTEAWWVEKNFVGQERLEKIYSPYAFGIERELSKEELKDYVWQKVLAGPMSRKSTS